MKEGKQYILGSVRGEGKEPEVTRAERPGTLPELLKAGSSYSIWVPFFLHDRKSRERNRNTLRFASPHFTILSLPNHAT